MEHARDPLEPSAASVTGSVALERLERVVFVTRALGRGGTEKHLEDLIDRFDVSTHEIVVLTMGLNPYTALSGHGRVPGVRVVPGPRTERFVTVWRFFRSLRPQVVVFVKGDFPLFHRNMYLAARFSGARRVVVIEHSIANPPPDTRLRVALRARRRKGQALWMWLTRPLRRRVTTRLPGLVCHATICVSDAVRDRLIRDYGYPAGKTITRRNGVDVRYFARDGGAWAMPQVLAGQKGNLVALCVALLAPLKRIDLLILAMKKVALSYPESRCVIVGGGPLEEQLRSMTKELGMEGTVLFVGQEDDIRPYLAAADVFVLPSEREGLPLVLLEAMAFGLPCVAAAAGGNREVIRESINGFVVPTGSADALADAIAKLFGDPEERVRMGKNARRIAEEEFDAEESMAELKSVILGAEAGLREPAIR